MQVTGTFLIITLLLTAEPIAGDDEEAAPADGGEEEGKILTSLWMVWLKNSKYVVFAQFSFEDFGGKKDGKLLFGFSFAFQLI